MRSDFLAKHGGFIRAMGDRYGIDTVSIGYGKGIAPTPTPTPIPIPKTKSAPGPSVAVPYEQILADWNAVAGKCGVVACRKLTKGRRDTIRTRWADTDWRTEYKQALDLLPSQPFAHGNNGQHWRMGFDFFLKPDSVTKILEGAYAGGQQPKGKDHQKTLGQIEAERRASNGA